MCKIAIIPRILEGKEDLAFAFAEAITPFMTKGDRDGFGYMGLGDKGLFGERWLDVTTAWGPSGLDKDEKVIARSYGETVEADLPVANRFGSHASTRIYSMALHSRMATCEKSLANVHPFIASDRKTGILHNGVITNHHKWTDKKSTCDSEAILLEFQKQRVADKFSDIQKMIAEFNGWYAVAAFSQDKRGKWFLDVFKETSASLEAAYVPELGSVVFCTRLQFIKAACKRLGWKMGASFRVADNIAIRHDAMTGEVLEKLQIKPVSWSYTPPTYARYDSKYDDDYEKWVDKEARKTGWLWAGAKKGDDETPPPALPLAAPAIQPPAIRAGVAERYLPQELSGRSDEPYDQGESDDGTDDQEESGAAEFNQGGGLHDDDGPVPVDVAMQRCANDPHYWQGEY